jgi:YVTN family beta-propeller protein
VAVAGLLALAAAAPARAGAHDGAGADSRSTNIALAEWGRKLVNVNTEANTVTVFKVSGDSLKKLAELAVGREPRCVAVASKGDKAFVTNSGDGTVSVVSLRDSDELKVVHTIKVGEEPRACALTTKGDLLYVANYTEGTLSVIDAHTYEVVDTVVVGGNPGALAIAKDDRKKKDSLLGRWGGGEDRVFVTLFFARPIAGGPGEGFDDGRQGVVKTFLVSDPGQVDEITLSPLPDSGFRSDRTKFCQQLSSTAVNNTFCPNPAGAADDPAITQDPQAVHPNQLGSAVVCGKKLYLPNIGAQPEPPVQFNANVQALVHVVDTKALAERTDLHVNLNQQIATEAAPADPVGSLQRAFGNDVVAIDSDAKCKNFFIVSRGGNYVLKAMVGEDGKLDIGAPDAVVRLPTGNIPTGIVVNGKYGYVNDEVDMTVTVLDLAGGTALATVPSATPPAPGSFDHARLLGRLVFFTALGVPDNGLVGAQIRDIDPVQFRGKQSADAWSTCASCHPDGLTDSITWIFGDGPRQAIPLDGLYSKLAGAHDARINNWSAVRDSITDFNNNSRGVQCGAGFAGGDPLALQPGTNVACPGTGPGLPNPAIFDHGLQQGGSEALDFETTWGQTVRALNAPKSGDASVTAGATVFQGACASCHGGAKWTKSQIIYLSNPALDKAFAAGGTPRDPGLTMVANQSVSYADARVEPARFLRFLDLVGTFDPANPIEIRGAGATIGQGPLGVAGFNGPSLLGVGSSAPYFHNGQAQTLQDVFDQHLLPSGVTIAAAFPANLGDLEAFLRTIDGRSPILRSETDDFKDPTKECPTCPATP